MDIMSTQWRRRYSDLQRLLQCPNGPHRVCLNNDTQYHHVDKMCGPADLISYT